MLSLNVPLPKEKCSELLNYRHSILIPSKIEDYLSWNPSPALLEHLQDISSDEALERTPRGYKYEEDGQYAKFSLGALYLVLKEEGENEWKYHDLEVVDERTLVRDGEGGWFVSQDVALDAFILKAEQLIQAAGAQTGTQTEQEKEHTANEDFWADFSDESDAEGNTARSIQPGAGDTQAQTQKQEEEYYARQAQEHLSSVDSGAHEKESGLDASTRTAIGGVWELYRRGRKAEKESSGSKSKGTDEESFLELVLQSLNA